MSALRLKSLFPAALLPFCAGVPAIGVGHCATFWVRLLPVIPSVIPAPPRRPSEWLGVVHCAACAGNGIPPAPKLWFGPPFSPSEAQGVPQLATLSFSVGPALALIRVPSIAKLRAPFASVPVAVGHDEDAEPFVRRASFAR